MLVVLGLLFLFLLAAFLAPMLRPLGDKPYVQEIQAMHPMPEPDLAGAASATGSGSAKLPRRAAAKSGAKAVAKGASASLESSQEGSDEIDESR